MRANIKLVWRGDSSTPMGAARKSETLQERSDEAARRSPHGKQAVASENK